MGNKKAPKLTDYIKKPWCYIFLLNGDGFSRRKIKNRLLAKCDDTSEVSKGKKGKE